MHGTRKIPAGDFYTGVKRNALRPDELIRAIVITPRQVPQQFSKIGTRNAMVIAVAAFSVALHPDTRTVGTGIGSAAPTPRRAPDAERFLAAALDDAGLWDSRGDLPESVASQFGRAGPAGGGAHRRCPRHRRLPAARAWRAGRPYPDLGLARLPSGRPAGRKGVTSGCVSR